MARGGSAIYYLLTTDTAVNSVVDGNVFPLYAPQTYSAPFITYQLATLEPNNTKSGGSITDFELYQVNIVAQDYDSCVSLSQAVRSALTYQRGSINGVDVQNISFQGERIQYMDEPHLTGYCMIAQDWRICVDTVSYDADALAFITAAGITDVTQKAAINYLVSRLKSTALWSKMYAVYPFIGGSASAHKYNLKSPADSNAAFRLTFYGGWTHDSNGAKPNGTNAYADTYLAPSTSLSLNSHGIGYYSGSNLPETSANPINMGVYISDSQNLEIGNKSSQIVGVANATPGSYSTAQMAGFFSVQKTAAAVTDIYIGSSSVLEFNSGGTLPHLSMFIGNTRTGSNPYGLGYVVNDFRFAYVSQGLSESDMSNLNSLVTGYQNLLGRNA